MKASQGRPLGILLIVFGALIVLLSKKIVFPGLEVLLGIETIVGKENVAYSSDGTYDFTNPGAMGRWIGCVVLVGLGITAFGAWLMRNARGHGSES